MAWYHPDDPRYPDWRDLDFTGEVYRWASAETDEAIECCALWCPQCEWTHDLTAILKFRELRCVEVMKLCFDQEIAWSDLGL
jgi:hypothetical protein